MVYRLAKLVYSHAPGLCHMAAVTQLILWRHP
jgi:hypothetical protein